MRRSSSTSAAAVYLDRAVRLDQLRAAARRASARMPAIRRFVLFGSTVAGVPTPRSDADILVVVDRSEHVQPRDRIPGLLGALAPLPCAVDLFVLTEAEFERAERAGAPLIRTVLATGVDLLQGPAAS